VVTLRMRGALVERLRELMEVSGLSSGEVIRGLIMDADPSNWQDRTTRINADALVLPLRVAASDNDGDESS
jgi:hypothetical protein